MTRLVRLDNFQQFAAINVLSDPGVHPGPVVIPNYCRVLLRWLLADGKIGTSVCGGTVSAGFVPTPALADAILAALTSGAAWTTLATFLATTTNLIRVDLQDIRTAQLPQVPGTNANHLGTSAGTALPDEVSLVITTRTNKVGPANRGRIYIPGWASNAVGAGGVVVAGAVTALSTWANTLPAAFSAGQVSIALAQPQRNEYTGKTGTLHPARAAASSPIISLSVRDNHWDSQRRRGLK